MEKKRGVRRGGEGGEKKGKISNTKRGGSKGGEAERKK